MGESPRTSSAEGQPDALPFYIRHGLLSFSNGVT